MSPGLAPRIRDTRPPGQRQLKFHVSPRTCFLTYAVNLQKHSAISPPPVFPLLVPISTSGHSCLIRFASASRCAPTAPCSCATNGALGLVVIGRHGQARGASVRWITTWYKCLRAPRAFRYSLVHTNVANLPCRKIHKVRLIARSGANVKLR